MRIYCSDMEPDTYTIIPDSFLDLDLTLTEAVILSVIYGFCQDGESDFHGSYAYLARKAKMQRRSAMRIVSRLEEMGLVSKEVREVNGVKSCSMRTTLGGGDRVSPVVTECHRGGDRVSLGGGDRVSPNNIDIENKEKTKSTPISPSFDFLSSLRALGVSAETAREWMAVRKTKRATNTRIAFDKVAAEIAKAGRPAEDCVRLCVENSWSGFKAEWMPAPEPVTGRVQSWEDYKKENGLI